MGLGSFVVVLLWCGGGLVVAKRGELTAVWRGEGRDWRGVSLVCGAFLGVVVMSVTGWLGVV
jgi:hypothetical protein